MTLHAKDRAARTIQRILVSELDPVSLRPIKIPYRLFRGGTHILYDGRVLYDFIKSTGDVRDPVARQALCRHELMRLCRLNKKPTFSEEALTLTNTGETGRRELLSFLEDEFVQEVRSSDVAIPMILEIFANIRSISDDEEMRSTLSHLRRNGIDIDVSSNFLPISIRIRTTENSNEESDEDPSPIQRVRTFAPNPIAIMAARAAIERSNASTNPVPPLGSIPSSDPRRVSLLLSDILPPILDTPNPPRYILDRIRQIREDRESTT